MGGTTPRYREIIALPNSGEDDGDAPDEPDDGNLSSQVEYTDDHGIPNEDILEPTDAIDSGADSTRETVVEPTEGVQSLSTASARWRPVDDEQTASVEEPTAVMEDTDERTDDIESRTEEIRSPTGEQCDDSDDIIDYLDEPAGVDVDERADPPGRRGIQRVFSGRTRVRVWTAAVLRT